MNLLIVFNHPAPYKIKLFNEIAKLVNLTVIFERSTVKGRDKKFYNDVSPNFKLIQLNDKKIGSEGSLSNGVKFFIKNHHKDFDFIIMNGYSHVAEIKAINYLIKNKIPYGIMVNGGFAKKNELRFKRKLKNKLIGNASFWFSPTKGCVDYLKFYGANSDKIYLYPYSNLSNEDLTKEYPDSIEIRKKYSLPLEKKIFVNSSQFIDRKNNFKLIKLFEHLDDYLLLIGNGKEEKKYRNYIKKNHINNIKILEYQAKENLFEIFHACNAFITLAKEDIFGQTTLEALANNLPVISSTKVNSSLEYIKNGINGYLVDISKDEEILAAIKNVEGLIGKNTINSIKEATFKNSAKVIVNALKELE